MDVRDHPRKLIVFAEFRKRAGYGSNLVDAEELSSI